MDRAVTMLRDYARNTNQHLIDVARDFIDRAVADSRVRAALAAPLAAERTKRRPDDGISPV